MTTTDQTGTPLTVIAQMRAKPGKEALLRAALEALIEPTTKDEGYINYDLHQGVDDPAVFVFYENWADRATHAAHMQAPHLQRFVAEHLGLLDGDLRVDLLRRVA
jgi:quinol monooxygenase YgiN